MACVVLGCKYPIPPAKKMKQHRSASICVSSTTIRRIVGEGTPNNGVFSTPGKKRRGEKKKRRKEEKKEIPTVMKLLQILRQDIDFNGGRESLRLRHTQFPSPTRLAMVMAPLQWLTALLTFIASPILGFPRLQTSQAMTQEHFCYLLNKYKPSWFVASPTLMTALLAADRSECDFSCLDTILLGGSAVSADLIESIREVSPTTEAFNVFGMSELTGVAFLNSNHKIAWACGQPIGCLQYRIIDCETRKDITEPNKPGELWLKGPGVFKGYYRNEAATEETFAEGRWLKTGDMFYFDENDNFFFVERIKLLLKYMSNQISPFELEDVIRRHPGVLDAAVTGIPDPECGDLPVACVVRSEGSTVTAEEIKQLVRESLTDSKQLRGGVIFVDAIPQTASTKVHRRHLKEMAMTMEKE